MTQTETGGVNQLYARFIQEPNPEAIGDQEIYMNQCYRVTGIQRSTTENRFSVTLEGIHLQLPYTGFGMERLSIYRICPSESEKTVFGIYRVRELDGLVIHDPMPIYTYNAN